MTQQQLLDALETKFWKVGTPKLFTTYAGVEWWKVPTLQKSGDIIWDVMVSYLKDGDDCYWKNSEPEKERFSGRVKTFLDAKIADNTVKFAIPKSWNEANKKVTIEAIMPDNTTKTVILTETTENNFTLEVI